MPTSRRLLAALAVLAVLLTVAFPADRAAAASCSGNSHVMKLSGGAAAPGSGTTSTTVRFTVTYTDNDGCTPDRIVLVVIGVGTYGLSHVTGGLQSGAVFGRTLTLPAGRWAYRFEASSGAGAGRRQAKLTSVSPPQVIVTAPAPKPTPTPKPKPTPKPVPTPQPIATPAAVATPAPTPRRTAGPTKPPSSPHASVAPSPTAEDPTPIPASTPGPPTARPSQAAVVAAGGPRDPAPPLALLKLAVSSVGTIGGLILFGLLFRRFLWAEPKIVLGPVPGRRRDDRPADAESTT